MNSEDHANRVAKITLARIGELTRDLAQFSKKYEHDDTISGNDLLSISLISYALMIAKFFAKFVDETCKSPHEVVVGADTNYDTKIRCTVIVRLESIGVKKEAEVVPSQSTLSTKTE